MAFIKVTENTPQLAAGMNRMGLYANQVKGLLVTKPNGVTGNRLF